MSARSKCVHAASRQDDSSTLWPFARADAPISFISYRKQCVLLLFNTTRTISGPPSALRAYPVSLHWPLKSFMAQRSDASMPETGRRPVSRMHRHEPQSLALRAAAGLSTGVECLKTPWGIDDEEPRRAAPAQLAPAGTRPIHPRPGGRRAFGHDCSALVTRVGEALDHGEDYKEQLQANRVQPLSPPSPEPLAVASSAHPKRATIGHQPLLAVAQPKPSAARRPPPFAVDSSYDARPSSAREPRHLPVSHGPRSTPRPEPDATKHTILEATRKLKEAGVSTRDSPVRHHRLGS